MVLLLAVAAVRADQTMTEQLLQLGMAIGLKVERVAGLVNQISSSRHLASAKLTLLQTKMTRVHLQRGWFAFGLALSPTRWLVVQIKKLKAGLRRTSQFKLASLADFVSVVHRRRLAESVRLPG